MLTRGNNGHSHHEPGRFPAGRSGAWCVARWCPHGSKVTRTRA